MTDPTLERMKITDYCKFVTWRHKNWKQLSDVSNNWERDAIIWNAAIASVRSESTTKEPAAEEGQVGQSAAADSTVDRTTVR